MTRRAVFLYQNGINSQQLNANIPRVGRNKKCKKPSFLKRQILIQEAFSCIKDKKFTDNGNIELAPNSQ